MDHVFTFLGEPDVQGTLVEVMLKHDFEKARALQFKVDFDLATYSLICESGVFGLTLESRTKSITETFAPDAPVRLSVFLSPILLAERFSSGQEAFTQEINACLQDMLTPESPLKQASSYTYLTARQTVPGQSFEAGFSNKAFEEMDSHLV
jgi:hypothetical protein